MKLIRMVRYPEIMETNISNFKTNVTLDQVMDFFNLNLSNVNQSEATQLHLFDLYEAYRTIEKEQIVVVRSVAWIIGTLIILSNLTVVISSGLILKKGQQPKSTYLLLGNVSLADTIVGISVIFTITRDNPVSSNPLCIFQIGMLVCPAMVSIFSVGLIAVDRYIYILHGLYYQRYFNTTRVRIGILCIWMIGITLGFMPVTGWNNTELLNTPCYYVSLFPGPLILINSFISIVPIVAVLILYSIILGRALKTVKVLNTTSISFKPHATRENSELRISRGTVRQTSSTQLTEIPEKTSMPRLTKSASYNNYYYGNEDEIIIKPIIETKSKSNHDLNLAQTKTANDFENIGNHSKPQSESMFSISTVDSQTSSPNLSMPPKSSRFQNQAKKIYNINNTKSKPKEPNKWRAITIVMLTSGCVLVTWMPFFISVTAFAFCEDKLTNTRCIYISSLLNGPLAIWAFLNSLLNPLIYAWWHKRFQESVRNYYRVFKLNHIFRIGIFISTLPAMGWTGRTFRDYRCWYIAVFPSALLLVLSFVVLSVIIMVCILYILILRSAVKAVDKIREFKESSYTNKGYLEDFSISTAVITISESFENGNNVEMRKFDSETQTETSNTSRKGRRFGYCRSRTTSHPSKLKAVKTVLILTLCFLFTWAPYYVAVIMYVNCDIMKNGYECIPLEILTLGPLYLLGVCNSLLDPIIYAWRHSGFKSTLKRIYWKCVTKHKI